MAMKQTPHTDDTFEARVSERETITLPPEVLRHFGIHPGDTIEIRIMKKVAEGKHPQESIDELRGILRPYFRDWEDINRFIAEERGTWMDPEDAEERTDSPDPTDGPSSKS
jgi:bifunctional DNA-binding transcriptional regulator/antitoxin component of YhaV-PrlF toxin-antitoxin module